MASSWKGWVSSLEQVRHWNPLAAAFSLLSCVFLQLLLANGTTKSSSSLEVVSNKPAPQSSLLSKHSKDRGKELLGRYLWCTKPQSRKVVVWDHFPPDFYWQMLLHGLKYNVCRQAPTGEQAFSTSYFILHSSFELLSCGLELFRAGNISQTQKRWC